MCVCVCDFLQLSRGRSLDSLLGFCQWSGDGTMFFFLRCLAGIELLIISKSSVLPGRPILSPLAGDSRMFLGCSVFSCWCSQGAGFSSTQAKIHGAKKCPQGARRCVLPWSPFHLLPLFHLSESSLCLFNLSCPGFLLFSVGRLGRSVSVPSWSVTGSPDLELKNIHLGYCCPKTCCLRLQFYDQFHQHC